MVGVACTGKGLLSGVDPAWDRGCPQHPWGLCRKPTPPTPPPPHPPPPACQSRCASGILSFLICKMGCLFLHQSQEGPHQAAFPASSSSFSARLRRLS